uniref:Secreted protein n=1 Tax=Pararge aegeria TaxID=116150 RepID=S4PRH1_9NEOP
MTFSVHLFVMQSLLSAIGEFPIALAKTASCDAWSMFAQRQSETYVIMKSKYASLLDKLIHFLYNVPL